MSVTDLIGRALRRAWHGPVGYGPHPGYAVCLGAGPDPDEPGHYLDHRVLMHARTVHQALAMAAVVADDPPAERQSRGFDPVCVFVTDPAGVKLAETPVRARRLVPA